MNIHSLIGIIGYYNHNNANNYFSEVHYKFVWLLFNKSPLLTAAIIKHWAVSGLTRLWYQLKLTGYIFIPTKGVNLH